MYLCPSCDGLIDKGYRFCPWCAAPQRLKLVEFFPPHPNMPHDHDKALRVSRYLGSIEEEKHVRFSVWGGKGEVKAAVSLAEDDADRLGRFLLREGRPAERAARDAERRAAS